MGVWLRDLTTFFPGDLLSAGAQLLAGAWFASLWQGLLLTSVVWVGLKIFPRTTAQLRFLVWTGLFLVSVLLPVWASWGMRGAGRAGERATLQPIVVDTRWAIALAGLFVGASLIRGFGLLRNAGRLRRLHRTSTPLDENLAKVLMSGDSGLRKPVLCTSTDTDQPCVIGFFAPRILLPEWLVTKATLTELRQIVLHETEHLRRFDDWTNLLQKVALVLFPLTPGLLFVERRLCAERERACDESVIQATHAPGEYASCLTRLAEQRLQRRAAVLFLGAWGRKPELSIRVESILVGGARMKAWQSAVMAAGLAAVTIVGAEKLAALPQLVSFAAPQPRLDIAHDSAFREVVFREKQARHESLASSLVADGPVQAVKPIRSPSAQKKDAAIRRPAVATKAKTNNEESWIVITRWEGPAGQITVTQVKHVMVFHPLPVVPLPSGWYVLSL